jgi:hypothetical protein
MIGNYHFPGDYGCPAPGMPLCRKRSRRNRDAPIWSKLQESLEPVKDLILILPVFLDQRPFVPVLRYRRYQAQEKGGTDKNHAKIAPQYSDASIRTTLPRRDLTFKLSTGTARRAGCDRSSTSSAYTRVRWMARRERSPRHSAPPAHISISKTIGKISY